MKRKDALGLLRVAGYHGDKRAFLRLYVENRISKTVAQAEFAKGAALKIAGYNCTCFECKEYQGAILHALKLGAES